MAHRLWGFYGVELVTLTKLLLHLLLVCWKRCQRAAKMAVHARGCLGGIPTCCCLAATGPFWTLIGQNWYTNYCSYVEHKFS